MAASDKTVKVTLVAVATPYAKGMAEASTATKRLGSDLDSVGQKSTGFASSAGKATSALKGMAVAGAAVAGTALVAFLGDAVKAAGDLEQSIGGVDAVFKDSAGQIHDFGKTSAESVGLSTNAFNELITVTGAMLKNKGLDDFANKSLDLIKIGADLSATYGGSAKDAVEALNAAMRGESDPIERYGISINETAVNAELAAKGLGKLTGAALDQAKAQARIDIITRQSADALGKFAGEADTLQGQQQRLNAEWENAKASLGGALLPALTSVVGALRSGVDVALAAAGAFEKIPTPIKAAVAALVALKIASGPISTVTSTLIGTVKSLGEALGYAAQASQRAGGGLAGASAGLKTFTGSAGLAAGATGALKAGVAGLGAFLASNVITLALTGIVAALGGFMQAQAAAEQAAKTLTDTMDKQTGAFTAASRVNVRDAIMGDLSPEDQKLLSDMGVSFTEAADAVIKGGPELDAYRGKLEQLRDTHPEVYGVVQGLISSLENQNEVTQKAAAAAQVLAKENTNGATATKTATAAAKDATPAFDSVAAKQKAIAEFAKIAADANRDLATALLDAAAAAGDADAAAISYQRALDAATTAAKENGRTAVDHGNKLGIATKKGQDNAQALLDLKNAAQQSATAQLKNGASVDSVKRSLETQRAEFVKTAKRMGLNEGAAQALADRYGYTKGQVDNLNKAMGKTPKQVASKIVVDSAAAQGVLRVVTGSLNFIDGFVANATVRTNYVSTGRPGPAAGNVNPLLIKKASGGPIYGPGTATSDSIPAMLSDGEYVIKAAAVAKYGTRFFDQANNMRLASGGPVQKFASGGAARVPLDSYYSDYIAKLGQTVTVEILSELRAASKKALSDLGTLGVTAANRRRNNDVALAKDQRSINEARAEVRAAKSNKERAAAQKRLADAQAKYEKDRRNFAAAEMKDDKAIAAGKDKLLKANRAILSAQARQRVQSQSALSKFGKGLAGGVKNTATFISNIEKLASRGFGTLAANLAEMSNEDAEKIAAEAANASTAELTKLQNTVAVGAQQQKELDHLGTITAILTQVKTKNLTARQMASVTGIDVMEILDSVDIIKGKLAGNRNATKLLADLTKRSKGQLFSTGGAVFGAGTKTSDSIPAWLSTGEYVVKADAVSKYGRTFFDALNGMRLAGGGPVSRMPANVTASLSPEALSRLGSGSVTLNAYGLDADAAVRRVQRDYEFKAVSGL